MALPNFIKLDGVGLSRDPSPKDFPKLIVEGLQTVRSDHLERQGAREINRVIGGEQKRNKVGYVIGMKMGEAEIIDLAEIKAHPGHLTQGPPSAVKKNQGGKKRQDQPRRAAVGRWNAGSRSKDKKFHFPLKGNADFRR